MSFHVPSGVRGIAGRAVGAIVRAGVWLRREAWPAHVRRVSTNPAYAAAMAAILGGLLGLSRARDVLAAVIAAALSAYRDGRGDLGSTGRVYPWNPL